jgi:hypothetical protein
MAIEDAPVVEVLKFDEEEAYNPDRPISGLIRTQLLHLHHAENLVVPIESRTNININHLLTEREAGDYIHKITVLLHQYGESDARNKSKKRRQSSRKKMDTRPEMKSTRSRPKSRQ